MMEMLLNKYLLIFGLLDVSSLTLVGCVKTNEAKIPENNVYYTFFVSVGFYYMYVKCVHVTLVAYEMLRSSVDIAISAYSQHIVDT